MTRRPPASAWRVATIPASVAAVLLGIAGSACGLGRPPSPATDAGAPRAQVADGASGMAPPAPLLSPDELLRLAEQAVRGAHASEVHEGRVPFASPLDLADGGCGRVAFVSDLPVVAQVEDATGARGEPVEAGARTLTLVPSGGPICAATGAAVTLRAVAAPAAGASGTSRAPSPAGAPAATVRWTTLTR